MHKTAHKMYNVFFKYEKRISLFSVIDLGRIFSSLNINLTSLSQLSLFKFWRNAIYWLETVGDGSESRITLAKRIYCYLYDVVENLKRLDPSKAHEWRPLIVIMGFIGNRMIKSWLVPHVFLRNIHYFTHEGHWWK